MKYFKLLLIFSCSILFACTEAPQEELPEVDKSMLNSSEPKLNTLNEQIEENPADAVALYKRAKLYYEIGNSAGAVSDLAEAIKINSQNGKFHHLLAKVYMQESKPVLALKSAIKASETGEQDADLLLLLTQLYFQQGDSVKASRYLSEAERVMPYHAEVYHFKALQKLAGKDTTAASASLKKAFRLDPSAGVSAAILADLYSRRGNQDSAMYFLIHALKAEPQNATVYESQGKVMKRLGFSVSATKAFETALALDSTAYYAALELARTYENENKLLKAAHLYKLYLSDKIFDKEAALALAGIMERSGQASEAIPLYKQILSSDSANVVIRKKLDALYLQFPEEKPVVPVKTDTATAGQVQQGQLPAAVQPKPEPAKPAMPLIKSQPKKVQSPDSVSPGKQSDQKVQEKTESVKPVHESEPVNKVELEIKSPVETAPPPPEPATEPEEKERKKRKKKEKTAE